MTYERDVTGTEALSLVDVKLHLNVTFPDDDTLIDSMISAAREWAETHTEKAIVDQEVTAYYTRLSGALTLPLGNATAVESIVYLDDDGAEQTVGDIYLLTKGTPNRIKLKPGEQWPSTNGQEDGVVVTYTAGSAFIPHRTRVALQMMVADMYEHRESQFVGTIRTDNETFNRLLFPLREVGL